MGLTADAGQATGWRVDVWQANGARWSTDARRTNPFPAVRPTFGMRLVQISVPDDRQDAVLDVIRERELGHSVTP